MLFFRSCALAALALVTAGPLAAAVTLASPFSDHAVPCLIFKTRPWRLRSVTAT